MQYEKPTLIQYEKPNSTLMQYEKPNSNSYSQIRKYFWEQNF